MKKGKPRRVFLVDDDDSHNQMLKNHLINKMNVEVISFATGEECLQNINKDPEVIILDFNLDSEEKQALNGLEILKKIKEQKPNTEVVMLSGQDKIEVAVETMRLGAFDYVIKNESAFLRAENVIFNVFKGLKLQENLKAYKLATYFLIAVIAAILITTAVLSITGVVKDY